MSTLIEQRVPGLGEFHDVEVVEVLVRPGDRVEAESPLITLETDKATMDVPATAAGVVQEVRVARGDRVSQGTLVAMLAAEDGDTVRVPSLTETVVMPRPGAADAAPPAAAGEATVRPGDVAADLTTRLLVLGAGPGGYTAAFRAADLGLDVMLVDRGAELGGVCLNIGCIPSKALLHAARVITDAAAMATHGIHFGTPQIDLDALRNWKDSVVGRLTAGLAALAKQRRVQVLTGHGRLLSQNRLELRDAGGGKRIIGFEHCIIATGSEPVRLPGLPDDPRLMDSTGALALADVPRRLLVIGGGIIGLEMACVYDALGAVVSVVEMTPTLLPGCDRDLVRPLEKRLRARYAALLTGTRVAGIEALDAGLRVSFEGGNAPEPQLFDRVLCAVGRAPSGRAIGAEAAGVSVDAHGFIPVDQQQRTNIAHILAIGDVTGRSDAGAQGRSRGQGRGRGGRRAPAGLRCTCDSVGGVHGSGDRLGRCHRGGGAGRRPPAGQGSLSLGRQRAFPRARA